VNFKIKIKIAILSTIQWPVPWLWQSAPPPLFSSNYLESITKALTLLIVQSYFFFITGMCCFSTIFPSPDIIFDDDEFNKNFKILLRYFFKKI